MQTDLGSSNVAVRNAAVTVLGTCHRQLGPSLAPLINSELKPAQKAILEETFAANPQESFVPTRKVRSKQLPCSNVRKGSESAELQASTKGPEPQVCDIQNLLPRTDISSQVNDLLHSSCFSSSSSKGQVSKIPLERAMPYVCCGLGFCT